MHRNGQYQSPVVQSCTEISGTRGDRIVESTQADGTPFQASTSTSSSPDIMSLSLSMYNILQENEPPLTSHRYSVEWAALIRHTSVQRIVVR